MLKCLNIANNLLCDIFYKIQLCIELVLNFYSCILAFYHFSILIFHLPRTIYRSISGGHVPNETMMDETSEMFALISSFSSKGIACV